MIGILKAYNQIIKRPQNVNATGNALHTLDHANAQIHQQEAYHYGAKISISAGSTVVFGGRTGATKVHFHGLSIVSDTGPIEMNFYHHAAFSGGTLITSGDSLHNRDLGIHDLPEMKIYTSPTIVDTGTLVLPSANPASPTVGGRSIGSEIALLGGFILATSDDNVITLTNLDTSTATVWAGFGFSEPAFE